jgi:hypothetical protein
MTQQHATPYTCTSPILQPSTLTHSSIVDDSFQTACHDTPEILIRTSLTVSKWCHCLFLQQYIAANFPKEAPLGSPRNPIIIKDSDDEN